MILDSYYTTDSAATFLGITSTTIRNLTIRKELRPVKVGNANLYHIDVLLACKDRLYADGLSPRQIGEKYGVHKSMVHYHFSRLNVRSIGVDGRRKGQPSIFDPDTVEKMAKIIGWTVSEDWADPPMMIRCPFCSAESPKNGTEYPNPIRCVKCGESFRVPA